MVIAGRTQTRWWGADVSYASCHAAEMVFGLGTAGRADRVTVHWVDGKVSTLVHVPKGVVHIDHATAVDPDPAGHRP